MKSITVPLFKEGFKSEIADLEIDTLIGLPRFSRRGEEEVYEWRLSFARKYSRLIILDFDVLCTEKELEKRWKDFEKLPRFFDRVRVQDFGVLTLVLERTDFDIELILETGHHNWPAIEGWLDLAGNRLKRVILSYELTKDKVSEYSSRLAERGIESEILFEGDILLFYSPRKLLQNQIKQESERINLFADSEESPHKGFQVVENQHGTFMYHLKKLFLLDRFSEIAKMSVSSLRIESDNPEVFKFLKSPSEEQLEKTIEGYQCQRTRGYFDVNKSHVLFPKLKNEKLEKSRGGMTGRVLMSRKGEYTVVRLDGHNSELKLGDELNFMTPEGKHFQSKVKRLSDAEGNEIPSLSAGKIGIINFIKKATPKTVLSLD